MKKIAFIGTGNMAFAIASGAIAAGTICPENIILFDTNESQYKKFDKGCTIATSIASLIKQADYIFLSVKPQNLKDVLSCIKDTELLGKTFVSICAGVPIESIQQKVGNIGIIRAMPNTPLLIGEGVTALCHNAYVSDSELSFIKGIFSASGMTTLISESDMNTITATTGSSPAYVYLFIKSICEATEKLGLSSSETVEMVCKTFIGAANMILSSDKSIDELISMVKSPNGTTEKALNIFDKRKITEIIYEAMKACSDRAYELSKLN